MTEQDVKAKAEEIIDRLTPLLEENARLGQERDLEALSGESIMECREMLEKHLGIDCGFFDDCVEAAMAMVKRERAARLKAEERAAAALSKDPA